MRSLSCAAHGRRGPPHRGDACRDAAVRRAQHGSRIADQPDLELADAIELVAVDVDLDDLELVVGAPGGERKLQPRADGEHHVGLGPERMAARQRVTERMALVEHALAAAIGDDRRGEALGQRAHLVGRLQRAAADEDHRAFGFRQQVRGALDRVLVERRLRLGGQAARSELDLGARLPACRAAPRARPGAAVPSAIRGTRAPTSAPAHPAASSRGRPTWSACAGCRSGRESRADSRDPCRCARLGIWPISASTRAPVE